MHVNQASERLFQGRPFQAAGGPKHFGSQSDRLGLQLDVLVTATRERATGKGRKSGGDSSTWRRLRGDVRECGGQPYKARKAGIGHGLPRDGALVRGTDAQEVGERKRGDFHVDCNQVG